MIRPTKMNYILALTVILEIIAAGCNPNQINSTKTALMKEKQISFGAKNHALDNNDNFSPDDRFLCYDTRGTVYNINLANCKSIEKIEIATGKETVIWEPESVTGEDAAPGVAAVSWHPSEDKVIFIHGPLLEEVEKRGYYGIRNRTGIEVSADGKGTVTLVDKREFELPITPGAQRGGTHRHEYTRNGNRIGFTYDDFLVQNIDRTIGYMEPVPEAPEGYTHYFAVLLKPAEKDKSKAGEIEKANGDSWVDAEGNMRAFIGKVRADNGIDYDTALFVADIPAGTDITSANPGDDKNYPAPPEGIVIRRLTHSGTVGGIVRGSFDGKKIAFLKRDENGIDQVWVIAADGSDQSDDPVKRPVQVSRLKQSASDVRWHPSDSRIFCITNGNIATLCTEEGERFGETVFLTNDDLEREELVVSRDGNSLAYSMFVQEDADDEKSFRQIFVLEIDSLRLAD